MTYDADHASQSGPAPALHEAPRRGVKRGQPIDPLKTYLGGELASKIGAHLDAHPPKPTKKQLADRYLADVLHALAEHPAATLAQLLAVLAGFDEAASGATFERAIASLVKAHSSRKRSTSKSSANETSLSHSAPASVPSNAEGGAAAPEASPSQLDNAAEYVGTVKKGATKVTQPDLLS